MYSVQKEAEWRPEMAECVVQQCGLLFKTELETFTIDSLGLGH